MATYFEGTGEGVEQDGEEKQSTARVETRSVILHLIEHTSNDQCHNEVSNQLGYGQTSITLETLEASDHAEINLFIDGNSVGRSHTPGYPLALRSINYSV
jgi:hypothetical protein